MKNLFKAIQDVQDAVGVMKQIRKNEFAKFNYIDYTDVVVNSKKELTKFGLVAYHTIEDRKLTTHLVHIDSGESISSSSEIIEMEAKGMNSYQVFGSGISYLKKYHLTGLLGLATDEKSMDELIEERKPKKAKTTDAVVDQFVTAVQNGTAKWTIEKFMAAYDLTEVQLNKINAL
jgi:hypothetical protein